MVAISLYRGNLHKAPDVPREWPMPPPKISVKDFRTLLERRNKALALVRTSNPNPSPNPPDAEAPKENNGSCVDPPKLELDTAAEDPEEEEGFKASGGSGSGAVKKGKELAVADCSTKEGGGCDSSPAEKVCGGAGDGKILQEPVVAKPIELGKSDAERSNKVAVVYKKEQRIKEIEDTLQVLNAKKHKLVQALKQILNAEEELKRRNTMQGLATHPPAQLQLEVTNDSGSVTLNPTPKLGLEANIGGNAGGIEADDASNQNGHSRYLLRTSSASPSSDSPLGRPFQHHMVPNPSRSSLGVAGSPSCFAAPGQAHPANLPTVSVSGTSYVTSSPSPAASGGTSMFRESRIPSPWN